MSSNAIAAVAVVLVSGFAGCAATAKAEPVAIVAPALVAPVTGAAPAPLRISLAPVMNRAITVTPNAFTLNC